jgi:RecJ-like exonuclease
MPQAHLDSAPAHRSIIVSRGNCDGLIGSSMAIRRRTTSRLHFHSHSAKTVELLRRTLGESSITVLDMGLDEALLAELNRKARMGVDVTYVDHHATSRSLLSELHPAITAIHDQSVSAGHLAWRTFGAWPDLQNLAVIADAGDRIQTGLRCAVDEARGADFSQHEAEVLDFSWRHRVQDDAYRHLTVRRMATGLLPSQITETRNRYRAARTGPHYERACRLAADHLACRGNVGYLDGAKTRSLNGFGALALQHACQRHGADVGCRLAWRGHDAVVSLRRYKGTLDAGAFLSEFALDYGGAGGGHPEAAGGRIPRIHLHAFRQQLEALA